MRCAYRCPRQGPKPVWAETAGHTLYMACRGAPGWRPSRHPRARPCGRSFQRAQGDAQIRRGQYPTRARQRNGMTFPVEVGVAVKDPCCHHAISALDLEMPQHLRLCERPRLSRQLRPIGHTLLRMFLDRCNPMRNRGRHCKPQLRCLQHPTCRHGHHQRRYPDRRNPCECQALIGRAR